MIDYTSVGFNLMKTFINYWNSFKTSDLLFYLGSIKDDEVIKVPYDVDLVKGLAF